MAQDFIYELLVRGNANGLAGAHVQRAKEITDEDGDTRLKIGKPTALRLEEVASVLGVETTKYITQIQTLEANALVESESKREWIEKSKDAEKLLDQANQTITTRDSQIADLNTRVVELSTETHVCCH